MNGLQVERKKIEELTVEQLVNKWTATATEQKRAFVRLATRLQDADEGLRRNGEQLVQLYRDSKELEKSRQELEDSLVMMRAEQEELQGMLDAADQLLKSAFEKSGCVEREGDSGFHTVLDVDHMLAQMDSKTEECVRMLNSVQDSRLRAGSSGSGAASVSMIVQVLNDHFATLQWVCGRAGALQEDLAKVKEQARRLASKQ